MKIRVLLLCFSVGIAVTGCTKKDSNSHTSSSPTQPTSDSPTVKTPPTVAERVHFWSPNETPKPIDYTLRVLPQKPKPPAGSPPILSVDSIALGQICMGFNGNERPFVNNYIEVIGTTVAPNMECCANEKNKITLRGPSQPNKRYHFEIVGLPEKGLAFDQVGIDRKVKLIGIVLHISDCLVMENCRYEDLGPGDSEPKVPTAEEFTGEFVADSAAAIKKYMSEEDRPTAVTATGKLLDKKLEGTYLRVRVEGKNGVTISVLVLASDDSSMAKPGQKLWINGIFKKYDEKSKTIEWSNGRVMFIWN